jgi:hypothetical protein
VAVVPRFALSRSPVLIFVLVVIIIVLFLVIIVALVVLYLRALEGSTAGRVVVKGLCSLQLVGLDLGFLVLICTLGFLEDREQLLALYDILSAPQQ